MSFILGGLIFLAILGTVIVSLPEQFNKKELKKTSLILWAVITALAIGASDTVSKHYINDTSIGNFFVYAAVAQVFVSFFYLKLQKEPLSQFRGIIKNLREYAYPLLGSLGVTIGTLLLFLAFQYAPASVASPITSTYPVITVLLAMIFLKDKITLKNWIGLVLVFASVLGIGFLGV